MVRLMYLLLPAILIFLPVFCWAQETKNTDPSAVQEILEKFESPANAIKIGVAEQRSPSVEFAIRRLEQEKFYVILLAILSVTSLVGTLYLMKGSSPTAEDIVQVMGLNFVIFGTIISVLIVSTQEQLAAVTGILGAMGGYLFGSKRAKG